ncbi:tyrosine-type recombinase/integrase [Bosea sp. (in: a-proteobacteria)]|jgi:integrase|uniref:tyrosine-type recombinase/integrase n=1 Tax=Bosea sp. (in: a-proteobacteria) TaxID=1871050 RepID=UPI002DDD4927|nr:integrase arm-type DNA-binding domain-containing protein [Bosea sp. (in: a-proteobacteria)]HEV2508613.1 integrase arm-type DNA-binding domain-containing protein [Bosea sp. (in: a-proteobacteria)]
MRSLFISDRPWPLTVAKIVGLLKHQGQQLGSRRPTMPLTDIAIRNAKPGASTVKLSDGGGLQLWIEPKGAKLWRLAYRFDGKQKKLSIGAYPAIDLKTARAKREEAKALLRDGKDPGAEKKLQKLTGKASRENTFEVVAAELRAQKVASGKAQTTIDKYDWHISLATPDLGKRPIAEISAAEALAVLRKVEARGRLETARRLRSIIGQVFRYAIATQRAKDDPTIALRGALTPPVVKGQAAVIERTAFGGLLRAVDGYEGSKLTTAALKLLALLFPRPGELRWSEWPEFDMVQAVWTVPAGRMKMRRPHAIPLPPQALAVLKEVRRISGNGRYLFPSERSVDRPMSENTLNAALRRLGYAKEDHTAHGFRASASTLLNESGLWSPDAVERALAHEEEDKSRRAYARGQYWDERVRMAQWWADQVDLMRAGSKFDWSVER